MMRLQELQRAFQHRVLNLEPGVEAELSVGTEADYEPRLDAYVDGYRVRLVEALGAMYPVLQQTLGDEEFDRRMRRYIDVTPSLTYSVRDYGADVGRRLSESGTEGEIQLGELARWEWLLADVFDAADDEPLDVGDLAEVSPSEWPDLRFTLCASVRRFDTSSNVVPWWRAANGLCDRPAALGPAPRSQWLLWRRGVKTLFRSLDPAEARLLDSVSSGATFGEICAMLIDGQDGSDTALQAAVRLRGWIEEALIAGYALPNEIE